MYEMPKRWVQSGMKVTIVTAVYDKSDLKLGKGLVSNEVIAGIKVRKINTLISNKHSKFKRIVHFLWFTIVSSMIALFDKYDIVLASSGPISVGIAGLIGKSRSKKFVFEVRDLWPQGAVELGIIKNKLIIKVSYWFEKLCYKKSDLIVSCSSGMADDIKLRYPDFKSKIAVVPNASDLDFFNTKSSQKNRLKEFVYTGSIGLMDDCMQLINAANLLNKRGRNDIELRIIGEGAELNDLKEASQELNNVHFAGLIPKTQVRYYLSHAIASLITFKPVKILNTSSPNKLFDALAAGVPVIQTTKGWIKDLVDNEKIGINVSPNDPDQMADAMEQLADNEDLQKKLASNARKVAELYFDREKLANQYYNYLTDLVVY